MLQYWLTSHGSNKGGPILRTNSSLNDKQWAIFLIWDRHLKSKSIVRTGTCWICWWKQVLSGRAFLLLKNVAIGFIHRVHHLKHALFILWERRLQRHKYYCLVSLAFKQPECREERKRQGCNPPPVLSAPRWISCTYGRRGLEISVQVGIEDRELQYSSRGWRLFWGSTQYCESLIQAMKSHLITHVAFRTFLSSPPWTRHWSGVAPSAPWSRERLAALRQSSPGRCNVSNPPDGRQPATQATHTHWTWIICTKTKLHEPNI